MRNWLSIVLVTVSGLVILACGGSGTDSGSRNSGGTGGSGGVTLTCETLTDPPEDCGKSCSSDTECEGAFCSSGVCAANCTGSEGCGPSESCNVRGRCVPDMSTGGTGGSGNTGGSLCRDIEVTPTRSIPNVMFLVDQSGSMDSNDFGANNDNRWAAAHDAITNIVNNPDPGDNLDEIVRFGLTTYTSRNGDENLPCPRLPVAGDPLAGAPRVEFGLGNGPTISDTNIFPRSYPSDAGEDTPTGDSIDALVDLIQANPPPAEGPTIIVLATDGEPDSCEYPDPSGGSPEQAFSRQEVVDAATRAHAAGIDVFVLWVGRLSSDSTRNHLQQVADAGVEGTGTVWVGDEPESLSSAFSSIIGDSISCEIEINNPFNPATIDEACRDGDVTLNGTPLECPADWLIKDEPPYNVIELQGGPNEPNSACQVFKREAVTFEAKFPCGTVIVQ
jgi:hypothetical protein